MWILFVFYFYQLLDFSDDPIKNLCDPMYGHNPNVEKHSFKCRVSFHNDFLIMSLTLVSNEKLNIFIFWSINWFSLTPWNNVRWTPAGLLALSGAQGQWWTRSTAVWSQDLDLSEAAADGNVCKTKSVQIKCPKSLSQRLESHCR